MHIGQNLLIRNNKQIIEVKVKEIKYESLILEDSKQNIYERKFWEVRKPLNER